MQVSTEDIVSPDMNDLIPWYAIKHLESEFHHDYA